MLRDAVRVLADERIAPRAAEIDRTAEFPWDIKELLASHDILGLPFPVEYGGLGGDLLTVCLAIEAISRGVRHDRPHPRRPGAGLAAAPHAAGTEEQKRRWFPDLAAGSTLIAFALTEAEAGSDAARRSGPGPSATATTTSSTARSASSATATSPTWSPSSRSPTRTPSATDNLSCFIVETDRRASRVARLEHKMGIRGSPDRRARLRRRPRPRPTNRVGAEGDGLRDRDEHVRAQSRPGIAAQAVGIAQGALEVAAALRQGARASSASRSASTRSSRDARRHGRRHRRRPASCCTRPARRSRPARPMPAAGRRCVNSWPVTRRCG